MRKRKVQINTIQHWRENLTPEEKKMLYLESIPGQVSASMAFEGDHVSLKMLKEYLRKLKGTHQPLAS